MSLLAGFRSIFGPHDTAEDVRRIVDDIKSESRAIYECTCVPCSEKWFMPWGKKPKACPHCGVEFTGSTEV